MEYRANGERWTHAFRAKLISDDEVDAALERAGLERVALARRAAHLARGAARQPRWRRLIWSAGGFTSFGQQERVPELNDGELDAARRRRLLGDEAALAGRLRPCPPRRHGRLTGMVERFRGRGRAQLEHPRVLAGTGLPSEVPSFCDSVSTSVPPGGMYAAIGSPSSACSCALGSSPPRDSTITRTARTATAARIFVRVLTARTARPGPGRRRRTSSRRRSARRVAGARAGA